MNDVLKHVLAQSSDLELVEKENINNFELV